MSDEAATHATYADKSPAARQRLLLLPILRYEPHHRVESRLLRREPAVAADREDAGGVFGRIVAGIDHRLITGALALFEQAAPDPPHEWIEPEQHFDDAMQVRLEVVVPRDVLAFVGQHDDSCRFSTVLIADDTANAQHPPEWFARSEPFACFGPAPFFSAEVTFADGATMKNRYSVVIADGDSDAARQRFSVRY